MKDGECNCRRLLGLVNCGGSLARKFHGTAGKFLPTAGQLPSVIYLRSDLVQLFATHDRKRL